MSNDSTRLFFRPSGTSPLTIRCAIPSTMAVLPTPGSPIRTGLFLVLRCNTWMQRRISSSRPITGSSFDCSALSVRSMVYFSSAWRDSSALGSLTCSPPRNSSMAFSIASRLAPVCFNISATGPLTSMAASTNNSLAMYWSSRFCASLSVTVRILTVSLERLTSPAAPETLGNESRRSPSCERSALTLTPALVRR